jgi:hypothetical protein
MLAAVLSPAQAVPSYETHPRRIRVEAPSEAVAGEDVRFSVLVAETWGSEGPAVPTAGVTDGVTLEITSDDPASGPARRIVIPAAEQGRATGTLRLATPGLWRIRASADAGLRGESAPVHVVPSVPGARVFWGDLQAHLHTPGAGHAGSLPLADYRTTLTEALQFARDVSLLDFCAVTPHIQTAGGLARRRPDEGNRSPWDVEQEVVEQFHAPGVFVPIAGVEWQGDAGDHCALFPEPAPLEAPGDFREFGARVAAAGGLLTAHAIYLPTRYEPRPPQPVAVEVTRDSQDMHALGLEALAQGVIPAFLGCSDTHGGAIGATGLTGLRAAALTRASVFQAVRQRRTWATNGERIVLDFRLDAAGDVPAVDLTGISTGAVQQVQIYRDERVVAQARGFGESPAFRFAWEDQDLLRIECLQDTLSYHAKVVQVTTNRYSSAQPDIAIFSPQVVKLEARHFDAAYARAGGSGNPPGAAIVALRDVWDAFRPAAGRALRSRLPDGARAPVWSAEDIARLGRAAADVEAHAVSDAALDGLGAAASRLAGVAKALQALEEVATAITAAESGSPASADLDGLLELLKAAHREAAEAAVGRPGLDWPALERSWFAARRIGTLPAENLERIRAMERAQWKDSSRRLRAVAGEQTRIVIDPRIVERLQPVTERARELAWEQTERWGYTGPLAPMDPAALPARTGVDAAAAPAVALRIRVFAEGDPSGAHLTIAGPDPGARDSGTAAFLPLSRSPRGWSAEVTHAQLPPPGELALEFPEPVSIGRVVLERADGADFGALGGIASAVLDRQGPLVRVKLDVREDSVDVALVTTADPPRPLWSGTLAPGNHALPFEATAVPEGVSAIARWGFAGWRRAGSVEVPGSEAARADGFGALADGRAVLALPRRMLLVDPRRGETEEIRYPPRVRQDPGKEFCVVPLPRWTLVRGASRPGGWAGLLDPVTSEWNEAPDGPAAGTVAVHPGGGYTWLAGDRLRRRLGDGSQAATLVVDAEGRLLGLDAAGWPGVRTARGEAVRVNPANGDVAARIRGTVLAMEPGGAVLVLDGMDARHRELARQIRVRRVLPDGTATGPHRLDLKTSPVLDPPVRVAFAADGAMLVRAGSTAWRREPDHDWWGAVIERWEPVWAGELRAD